MIKTTDCEYNGIGCILVAPPSSMFAFLLSNSPGYFVRDTRGSEEADSTSLVLVNDQEWTCDLRRFS